MKQLIVCSSFDLHRLENIIADVSTDTTVLMSVSSFDETLLGKMATDKVKLNSTYDCNNNNSRLELLQELKGLERTYFVVSSPVMISSAYQSMIYSLFPRMLQVDCWKITLETTQIPFGFAFLRHLPEGVPL